MYERAPELREVGAGISLWANAIRALDCLGASEAVRARSLPMTLSELRAGEGRKILLSTTAETRERHIGSSPAGVMIHRAELVGALAELLPEGTVRFGHECVGVDQTSNGPSVHFSSRDSDQADAVIGADGIHSIIRQNLYGDQTPRYSGYTCWRGICQRPSIIDPGYIGEWWGRGKRFGITTLTQDRVYWFAVYNAPPEQQILDGHATLTKLFKGWRDPVLEIIANTPPDRLVHNDIIDRPPMEKNGTGNSPWSRGAIGLMGDAAHPTTPNLGQGGCMAIEDAVALARTLSKNQDTATGLASFASERYQRTASITNESWQLGKIAQLEGRWSCTLRDSILGLLLPWFGAKSLAKNAEFDVGRLVN